MKPTLKFTRKHLALKCSVILSFLNRVGNKYCRKQWWKEDKNSKQRSEFVAFVVWRDDNWWKIWDYSFLSSRLTRLLFSCGKWTITKISWCLQFLTPFLVKTFLCLANVQWKGKANALNASFSISITIIWNV